MTINPYTPIKPPTPVFGFWSRFWVAICLSQISNNGGVIGGYGLMRYRNLNTECDWVP